jgi:hypothetical protein
MDSSLVDKFEYDYLNARKRLDAINIIAELNPEEAKLIRKDTDNEEYVKSLKKKAVLERINFLNYEINELLNTNKKKYPDKSIREIMDILSDDDSPGNIFEIIHEKFGHLNKLAKESLTDVWSQWKTGSYAYIGDGKLFGPYESYEDMYKSISDMEIISGCGFQVNVKLRQYLIG